MGVRGAQTVGGAVPATPLRVDPVGTTAQPVTQTPSNLSVTASAPAGTGVTCTLPAFSTGYHYISEIRISAYTAVAVAGAALPLIVNTTNITGLPPQFDFQTAKAIGTSEVQVLEPPVEIKSAASNTATTIVCPAQAGVIWRVTVIYRAAA